ncbi:MAG: hypothetical protein HOP16_16050 [Acidobacteria bacterium]|nr:hypothetical protein [Acidobacteriota bacterium]
MSRDIEIAFPKGLRGQPFAEAVARLRVAADAPDALSYRGRLQALNDLSDRLLAPDVPMGSLSGAGVPFLAAFLRSSNLEHMVAREVALPESLERFTAVGRKSLRILPKGLACHWVAGNVPLLGMFSWALSALVGNVNVIRLSSRQEDLVTPLLQLLESASPEGRRLASETLVVFFDRDDAAAHGVMSEAADVRIAWGGKEAIEAIAALPTRWESETIVLGPRVSLAVVDPAHISDRTITRLATDIAYFDQLACSSPHYLFVKNDSGAASFDAFVDRFAAAFDAQARAIPRHPLDLSETYQIHLDRSRVLLDGGTLRRDDETKWTVALLESPSRTLTCANRFLEVVPFASFEEIYPHIPLNVQTIVTSLGTEDTETFTDRAARLGVCRFPSPGEGNHFESPWDGLPMISRLTRWALRTDARSQ